MTRNYNYNRVFATGIGDCSPGFRTPYSFSEFSVRNRFSKRNFLHLFPNLFLKKRSFWTDSQVEIYSIARKIFLELLLCIIGSVAALLGGVAERY